MIDALLATGGTPEGLYGRRKMTALLRRRGLLVSHHTVDRLMRDLGLNGVRRGKKVRKTVPDPDAKTRPTDLLERDFTAAVPNQRWVADFTYCRTWAGWVFVAFVVDVYAQRIVGWHASTTRTTDLVLTCLRMAVWQREHDGHPVVPGKLIHHHDAGSQYTALRFTEHLALEGIAPSIGSVGDAYALMESIIGLFKAECMRPGPLHQRPHQDHQRRRVRDDGLGRLVEQPAPALKHRHGPAHRAREHALPSDRYAPTGGAAHMKTAEDAGRCTAAL